MNHDLIYFRQKLSIELGKCLNSDEKNFKEDLSSDGKISDNTNEFKRIIIQKLKDIRTNNFNSELKLIWKKTKTINDFWTAKIKLEEKTI